jgi:nucleoid DNA-binding protein
MAVKSAPVKPTPKPAPPKPAPGKPASPSGQGNGQAAAKPMMRGELLTTIGNKCGMTKRQIGEVFEALNEVIATQLGKKGPGVFQIHGLLKLKVVRKPATKAKQGVNPFTKEPMTYKAKPARNVVKALPLKFLKELV